MESKSQPDWAPDDCPDNVIELIDIEAQLGRLGLRGLASPDSTEVRTGYRRLVHHLQANYQHGRRDGLWIGGVVGLVLGVAIGVLALLTA